MTMTETSMEPAVQQVSMTAVQQESGAAGGDVPLKQRRDAFVVSLFDPREDAESRRAKEISYQQFSSKMQRLYPPTSSAQSLPPRWPSLAVSYGFGSADPDEPDAGHGEVNTSGRVLSFLDRKAAAVELQRIRDLGAYSRMELLHIAAMMRKLSLQEVDGAPATSKTNRRKVVEQHLVASSVAEQQGPKKRRDARSRAGSTTSTGNDHGDGSAPSSSTQEGASQESASEAPSEPQRGVEDPITKHDADAEVPPLPNVIHFRFPIVQAREKLEGPDLDAALLRAVSATAPLAQMKKSAESTNCSSLHLLPRNWHEASGAGKIDALAHALLNGLWPQVDLMQPSSEIFRAQIAAVEDRAAVLRRVFSLYAEQKNRAVEEDRGRGATVSKVQNFKAGKRTGGPPSSSGSSGNAGSARGESYQQARLVGVPKKTSRKNRRTRVQRGLVVDGDSVGLQQEPADEELDPGEAAEEAEGTAPEEGAAPFQLATNRRTQMTEAQLLLPKEGSARAHLVERFGAALQWCVSGGQHLNHAATGRGVGFAAENDAEGATAELERILSVSAAAGALSVMLTYQSTGEAPGWRCTSTADLESWSVSLVDVLSAMAVAKLFRPELLQLLSDSVVQPITETTSTSDDEELQPALASFSIASEEDGEDDEEELGPGVRASDTRALGRNPYALLAGNEHTTVQTSDSDGDDHDEDFFHEQGAAVLRNATRARPSQARRGPRAERDDDERAQQLLQWLTENFDGSAANGLSTCRTKAERHQHNEEVLLRDKLRKLHLQRLVLFAIRRAFEVDAVGLGDDDSHIMHAPIIVPNDVVVGHVEAAFHAVEDRFMRILREKTNAEDGGNEGVGDVLRSAQKKSSVLGSAASQLQEQCRRTLAVLAVAANQRALDVTGGGAAVESADSFSRLRSRITALESGGGGPLLRGVRTGRERLLDELEREFVLLFADMLDIYHGTSSSTTERELLHQRQELARWAVARARDLQNLANTGQLVGPERTRTTEKEMLLRQKQRQYLWLAEKVDIALPESVLQDLVEMADTQAQKVLQLQLKFFYPNHELLKAAVRGRPL